MLKILGLLQLLYYILRPKSKSKSGVMITCSHNPKNYNGLKLVINDKPISGNEICRLINQNIDESIHPGKISEKILGTCT